MDDTEPLIDALYAGPPGEFTGARDALAKRLRADGRREEAERVRGLRRPTSLAADLNRLVRDSPERIAAVLAAEERLRAAQGRMLAGDGGADELRAAEADEAQAIAALSGGHAVHAALRLAARSERHRESLRLGRLSQDPVPDDASSGLFALGPAPPPPVAGTRSTPAPPKDDLAAARSTRAARRAEADAVRAREEAERAAALEAAAAVLDASRERERAAADGLEAARERSEEEAAEHDRLAAERDRLRAELAEAEAALTATERDAREARAELGEAEKAVQEARTARAEAEDAARDLLQASPDG